MNKLSNFYTRGIRRLVRTCIMACLGFFFRVISRDIATFMWFIMKLSSFQATEQSEGRKMLKMSHIIVKNAHSCFRLESQLTIWSRPRLTFEHNDYTRRIAPGGMKLRGRFVVRAFRLGLMARFVSVVLCPLYLSLLLYRAISLGWSRAPAPRETRSWLTS